MQTLCKHYYKPRKSAIDISVSINVMSRNCEGFPAFASQTPINGLKYLGRWWKTKRAGNDVSASPCPNQSERNSHG